MKLIEILINRAKSLYHIIKLRFLKFLSDHKILVEYHGSCNASHLPVQTPRAYCTVGEDYYIQGNLSYAVNRVDYHEISEYRWIHSKKPVEVLIDSTSTTFEISMKFMATRITLCKNMNRWVTAHRNCHGDVTRVTFRKGTINAFVKNSDIEFEHFDVDFSKAVFMMKSTVNLCDQEDYEYTISRSLKMMKKEYEKKLLMDYDSIVHDCTYGSFDLSHQFDYDGNDTTRLLRGCLCSRCRFPRISIKGKSLRCPMCGYDLFNVVSDFDWHKSLVESHEALADMVF